MVLLISADLFTKKLATDNLNFHLSLQQHQKAGTATPRDAMMDGIEDIHILGDDGELIRLFLVFNDRFVFGMGPSVPVLGFFLTFFAICFLFLYRWKTYEVGNSIAWLMVFSGALGNLFDKMFVKNLATREWSLSLTPQPGTVSGVVDFVDCIWFGLDQFEGIFGLSWLAWSRWPTFNLADSLIVVGIILLLITMTLYKPEEEQEQ